MIVLARSHLTPPVVRDDNLLLLEGAWPQPPEAARCWSLDEAIDVRHAWIDQQAEQLAEVCAADALSPAGINVLALRYYLVRLLRVCVFFDEVLPGHLRSEPLTLVLEDSRDDDYALLLADYAHRFGVPLKIVRHAPGSQSDRSPATNANTWLRRRVGELIRPAVERPLPPAPSGQPRVVVCGNRRILNPVCDELLCRGSQIWWLYDQPAAGGWWRWRGRPVRQISCSSDRGPWRAFADAGTGQRLMVRGFDLRPAVDGWLGRIAYDAGVQQARWIDRLQLAFASLRPTHLVLDEDATPLKRVAVALARRAAARSIVVQHGVTCIRFGFAPLAADTIAVWDDTARQQLLRWGVDDHRIHVTGRITDGLPLAPPRQRTSGPLHIVLLATTPPDDRRPDAVAFHLTTASFCEMLRAALATARRLGARVTLRLHPRTGSRHLFDEILRQYADVAVHVDCRGDLATALTQGDFAISMPSSSGIEAAQAGWPVVLLMPHGSGDVLPAHNWGMWGPARTQTELNSLCDAILSLHGKPHSPLRAAQNDPRDAARRVVEALLDPPIAEPAACRKSVGRHPVSCTT